MKTRYLTLLCLLLSLSVFAQKNKKQPERDRFANLDTTFARVLKDWHAAGFAVAVVEKNKVVYAKGFGYRDYEQKIPVTPNTSFAIGSCTKAFTSSLIGLLQKEGKLDYDKSAVTYLPNLKFFTPELTQQITVRDMMCHRTGLPRHDYSWYLCPTSKDSTLARIAFMEPSAALRQKWQYNNFMFFLQGQIAEKLTNKSWEENIKTKLFEPLGMKASFFSVKDFPKQPEPAKGYEVKKDSLIKASDYYEIGSMGAAGSINSTVLDMAKWVQLWINGGKFEGKEVLPTAYVTEAQSSQMVISAGLPTKEVPDAHFANYGFGWFLSSYRGHYRVEHGGNIDGFSANTAFFPSDSVGVVVLCNQNGSPIPTIVRNTIADRLFNLPYHDWNGDRLKATNKAKKEAKEAEKKTVSNQKMGTKPSHPLSDYEGLYVNEGYGRYPIKLHKDSLFLTTPVTRVYLRHFHYDTFQDFEAKKAIDTTEKGSLRLQFLTNTAGDIESLSVTGLEPSINKPIIFMKTALPKPITIDELKRYVGDYALAGITMKVFLKNDKTLTLLVPNQPEYELISVGNHTFDFAKPAGFSVVFEVNAQNEATAVTVKQPHGNFKADRKK